MWSAAIAYCKHSCLQYAMAADHSYCKSHCQQSSLLHTMRSSSTCWHRRVHLACSTQGHQDMHELVTCVMSKTSRFRWTTAVLLGVFRRCRSKQHHCRALGPMSCPAHGMQLSIRIHQIHGDMTTLSVHVMFTRACLYIAVYRRQLATVQLSRDRQQLTGAPRRDRRFRTCCCHRITCFAMCFWNEWLGTVADIAACSFRVAC